MSAPEGQRLLGQPTRARLFSALRELRRAATTEELATALGLHVNGVRRHLERMESGGLLERSRARHGRGRPRDEWSIASGAGPDGDPPQGYADVARWLARATPTGPAGLRRLERTGREIGRELVDGPVDDAPGAFRRTFAALGFQPSVAAGDGTMTAKFYNCPYRDSVRESPDVICILHRGVTVGVLDTLDPGAGLVGFEPHDPDRAGCMVEVALAPANFAAAPTRGRRR
ncbi:MAG: helix-turn-helix domain-containing protein [Solirubrobacterales bacterium]